MRRISYILTCNPGTASDMICCLGLESVRYTVPVRVGEVVDLYGIRGSNTDRTVQRKTGGNPDVNVFDVYYGVDEIGTNGPDDHP